MKNLFGLLKKRKKKFYISFPNNMLDNFFHFFLPVFLKHASIINILNIFKDMEKYYE